MMVDDGDGDGDGDGSDDGDDSFFFFFFFFFFDENDDDDDDVAGGEETAPQAENQGKAGENAQGGPRVACSEDEEAEAEERQEERY